MSVLQALAAGRRRDVWRSWAVAIVCSLALPVGAQAQAALPTDAEIQLGAGMAGVSLGATALDAEALWGPVDGFCFEGSLCGWNISKNVGATVVLEYGEAVTLHTTVPGWKTRKGVGPGSKVSELRKRHGSKLKRARASCFNGFGGQHVGYVINARVAGEQRFTFFETGKPRKRVRGIWIGAGRAEYVPGC